jgi:hypothetical protein
MFGLRLFSFMNEYFMNMYEFINYERMIAANISNNNKIAAKKSMSDLSRFIFRSSFSFLFVARQFKHRKFGPHHQFGGGFGFFQ